MAELVDNTEVNEFNEDGLILEDNPKNHNEESKTKKYLGLQRGVGSQFRPIRYYETGFSNPVQDNGFGTSKFDGEFDTVNPFTYNNIDEIRAANQSILARIGIGGVRMLTTAATTFADNIFGSIYGLGQMIWEGANTGDWGTHYVFQGEDGQLYTSDNYDMVEGNIIDKQTGHPIEVKGKVASSYNKSLNRFITNDVSEALHAFNNKMREWMPIYTSKEYNTNQDEGRWWRNLDESAWWGNALENMGFTIGSALAMYFTGGSFWGRAQQTKNLRNVIKKGTVEGLEDAETAAKRVAAGRLGIQSEQTAEQLGAKLMGNTATGSLSNVGSTIASNASKLHNRNIAWNIFGSMLGSLGEARLESLSAGDVLAGKIDLINQAYDDEIAGIEDSIAEEHPNWFVDFTDDNGESHRLYSTQFNEEMERRTEEAKKRKADAQMLLAHQSNAMANSVFAWNMAVLPASNYVAYGQFLSPGTKFAKMNTKSAVKQSWRSVSKGLKNEGYDKATRKSIVNELKKIEAAGGYQGQAIRQLKPSWWHTKGADFFKGLLQPLRESQEEMLQNVAQQAANYSVGSSLNEFFGYALDPEGADHAVSFYNSLAEGFKKSYSAQGLEEGFMGAITALLPIPGIGMHVNRRRSRTGKKGQGLKGLLSVNNEFWNGIAGLWGGNMKSQQAQALADAYNAYYNDPNGRNTSLLDAIVRNESLDKAMQDAIDNGDDFNIIGINNKKLWNIASLYAKLGRLDELKEQLDEIGAIGDRELGEQVLQAYANNDEDYSTKLHSYYDAESVGHKIKENAVKYKDKLDKFADTQNKIYNLYGSVEIGDFTDDFLAEMTYMTMEAGSMEDRFADLLEKTVPTLQNALDKLPLGMRTLSAKNLVKLNEFLTKYKQAKSDNEKVGTIAQLFNDKEMVDALSDIMNTIVNRQYMQDQTLGAIEQESASLRDVIIKLKTKRKNTIKGAEKKELKELRGKDKLTKQEKLRLKVLETKELEAFTDEDKEELASLEEVLQQKEKEREEASGSLDNLSDIVEDNNQFYTDVNDLFKLLALRRNYIDRINMLAENPNLFVKGADNALNKFEEQMKVLKMQQYVDKYKDAQGVEDLDNLRGEVSNEQEFNDVLKELAKNGNQVAAEYHKMRNFNKHVIVELQLQEYRENIEIQEKIAELKQQITATQIAAQQSIENLLEERGIAEQEAQFGLRVEDNLRKIAEIDKKIQRYNEILQFYSDRLDYVLAEEERANAEIERLEQENEELRSLYFKSTRKHGKGKHQKNQNRKKEYKSAKRTNEREIGEQQEQRETLQNAAQELYEAGEYVEDEITEEQNKRQEILDQLNQIHKDLNELVSKTEAEMEKAREPFNRTIGELENQIESLQAMEHGREGYHNAKVLFSILQAKANTFAQLSNVDYATFEEFKAHYLDEMQQGVRNANIPLSDDELREKFEEAQAILRQIFGKYKAIINDKNNASTVSNPKPNPPSNPPIGPTGTNATPNNNNQTPPQAPPPNNTRPQGKPIQDPALQQATAGLALDLEDIEDKPSRRSDGDASPETETLSLGGDFVVAIDGKPVEQQQQQTEQQPTEETETNENRQPIVVESGDDIAKSNTDDQESGSLVQPLTSGQIAPFLQEFETSKQKGEDRFKRFIDTEKGRGFSVLYNYLMTNNAFSYVDTLGNIYKGQRVYLATNKDLDNRISQSIGTSAFTVLLVVKDENNIEHIVGSLDYNAINQLKVTDELKLQTSYDSQQGDGFVTSNISLQVDDLRGGYVILNKDSKARYSLKDANLNNPKIVYVDKNGQFRKLDEYEDAAEVSDVRNQDKIQNTNPGFTFLKVPTIDGRSIAVQLEFNLYMPGHAVGLVKQHVEDLWKSVRGYISMNDELRDRNNKGLIDRINEYFTFEYRKKGKEYRFIVTNNDNKNTVDFVLQEMDVIDDKAVESTARDIETINVGDFNSFETFLSRGYYDGYTTEDGMDYVMDLINSDAFSTNYDPEIDNPLASKSNWFTMDTTTLNYNTEAQTQQQPANTIETSSIEEPVGEMTDTFAIDLSEKEQLPDDKFSLEDEDVERTTNQEIDKELNRLYDMLPQFSKEGRVSVVNDMIRVAQKGKVAGGMFTNGMITISRMAQQGTIYHEAFHAVFHLLMTEEEQKEIMDAAKKVWGGKNAVELEENLAEGYREYVMTRDEYGLGAAIINFFKKLLGLAENWNEVMPVFNRVYNDIYEGKFGNRQIVNEKVESLYQMKQDLGVKAETDKNNTTLSNTEYNSLTDLEKQAAEKCHSK